MFSALRQHIFKKFGLGLGEADALVARLWKYFFSLELEATTAIRGETLTRHITLIGPGDDACLWSAPSWGTPLGKRTQACRATVAYPRETDGMASSCIVTIYSHCAVF